MLTIQKILESLKVFDPLIKQVKDTLDSITVNENVGRILSDVIPIGSVESKEKIISLYSETEYPSIDLISFYLIPSSSNETNISISNIMTDYANEMDGGLYKTTYSIVVNALNFAGNSGNVHIRYVVQ